MLSVLYCAVLGAAGAIACVTKRSSIRCIAIAVMLLIALHLVTGLLSNFSTWDVSDYLVYPLPLTIFVADILLITYLHWRRPNLPTSVRSIQ